MRSRWHGSLVLLHAHKWLLCWKYRENLLRYMRCVSHRTTRYILCNSFHDDVIKWKHFPLYWSFVRGIHRSPVNSPHKGQWRGASMSSLIWINSWINNREADDLRRYRAHYDVIVMFIWSAKCTAVPTLSGQQQQKWLKCVDINDKSAKRVQVLRRCWSEI